MRGKMLGRVKHFGRCRLRGHGCRCTLSQEIQVKPRGRAAEKREWRKDSHA